MHELSLCESIINTIESQATIQRFQSVSVVWLEIGRLSDVEPEALRFAFEIAKRGSIAEQALLEIVEIAGQAWCSSCNQLVEILQLYDACPHCGNPAMQIQNGQQMRIQQLEVQ